MSKSSLSTIGSVLFMLVAFVSMFYIWNQSAKVDDSEYYDSVEIYAPVDISGLKTQANTIISGYNNNSGIPIAVPLGKMGKINPFTDPE